MKKLIMKLLGLNVLIEATVLLTEKVDALEAENAGLKTKIENLENEVHEMDVPNMDEWVLEDDINDRIESYLNDNDYVTQSYCDDEIESKVSDAVESAIEDLDIENTVAEAIDKMDSRPDRKVEEMVKEAVKVTLERVVKAMADQQG